ncbi:undecaprenyl-diphosphate phosphatase [Candidatus Pacearchaeota archaeon]|nr:undecaprenyl-diphosphate phosphatase [Candidatus Pacearchaeota archaeon]
MQELILSLIIAVVQGLTEWLPVSSSGHLVIFEKLLNFNGGLKFDVALHFGTLMAVFVYFGSDIIGIIRDLLMRNWQSEKSRLGLFVLIATIPAALAGFFLRNIFEVAFSNLTIVALGFAVTGIFLLIAGISSNKKKEFGYSGALVVGLAQAFALFPGVSRSGSTIGSGMLLGLEDKEAIKFSFLMSIPVIFGANLLTIGNETLNPTLIWATLVSFFVGLVSIHLLYGYVLTKKKNLKWFAAYALVLALVTGMWVLFL